MFFWHVQLFQMNSFQDDIKRAMPCFSGRTLDGARTEATRLTQLLVRKAQNGGCGIWYVKIKLRKFRGSFYVLFYDL